MQIYECLKNDHEELKAVLTDLVALKEDDDFRFVLIDQIRSMLVPHSRAEESVFYNTLRAVNADGSRVRHGYQEHMEAETLLCTLQVMDKLNLEWKGIAKKLKEGIEHHIQEEETQIFAEARKVFTAEEAESIGQAFESLKPQIQKEGFMKTSMDLILNLLPPRFVDKMRNIDLGNSSHS